MMPTRMVVAWKVVAQRGAWGMPLLGLIVALVLALGGLSSARAAEDFGQSEAGRRVYDRAGLLTAAEVRDLEARAAAVERAGAPTIVYLRSNDADEDDTRDDARELMDAWNVQSAQDARDGVVIFLNLEPDDPRRGRAAIWAGERHAQNGNLPERELRRIYDEVMTPLLRDDQTAAGIGAGLDSLANSLTVGPPPPPPPSAIQRAAANLAGLPFAIVAVFVSGVLALLSSRAWSVRSAPAARMAPTANRPGDLPPALASALVARRIEPTALTEATVLDFARRGAIAIEPRGGKEIAVRLLAANPARHPFEEVIWASLTGAANAAGVIAPKQLAQVSKTGERFQEALKGELQARGWFDPNISARQRPLYVGGTVALVLAVIAFIVAVVGKQPWGLFGVGLLATVGLVALLFGGYYPQTTAAGEEAAAPWHAYKAGLQAATKDRDRSLDLDVTLPDAVAFGLTAALDKRLKEASERGYAPSWFVGQSGQEGGMAAFYPYWIIFHSAASPSSTGTGNSASSGGAGAGGSF